MSFFAWLDHSEADRRRMLDVLDQFREKGTVDELGVGTVRDALADRLFPGTSTVMSRARYYLFVPWIFRALEDRAPEAGKFATRSRRAELDLCESIEKSSDREGNIGRRAGRNLKRLPSDIYWAGLGAWGIRKSAGSRADYMAGLREQRAWARSRRGREDGRDAEGMDDAPGWWHEGLPDPPQAFPGECSLALRRMDALYLEHRLRTAPGTSGSLLAHLVSRGQAGLDTDFVWEHPQEAAWPARLRNEVAHARMFSEVMHGAALLYNLLLAKACGEVWEEGAAEYEGLITEWAGMMEDRRREFEAWNRAEFWQLVRETNPRLAGRTRDFCEAWWEICRSRLHGGTAAAALIAARERQLKGPLARLVNASARERWSGASGAAQLDFRWGIARTFLRDIFDGLAREPEADEP